LKIAPKYGRNGVWTGQAQGISGPISRTGMMADLMHGNSADLAGWTPPPRPGWDRIDGRYVALERSDPARHAEDLFAANSESDAIWDHLPYGPFRDMSAYRDWLAEIAAKDDPHFYTLIDKASGKAGGVASYLRIDTANGAIEVGHINLAPVLQRSRAATEAMYLMMRWAFDAGYRRYEWKCDARNFPSRRAAERFGFSYEGIFRQAAVVKGRNRDTVWFAAIDKDWPKLHAAYERWLDPANFDAAGRQSLSLAELTHPLLVARDPGL
jgi:RimJ/RimL family protein N-acetyltransferase